MSKRFFSIISACVLLFSATSCVSGLLDLFSKLESYSFLKNESSKDVIVSYTYLDKDYSFTVPSGEEVEIPDLERWHLVQSPDAVGIVTFIFSDGFCISQGCTHVIFDDGTGRYDFTPAKGNILQDESWAVSSLGGNRQKYVFSITEPSK